MDGIPKVKVHNWLSALVLSVHCLAKQKLSGWMFNSNILAMKQLKYFHSLSGIRSTFCLFEFFAFIHTTNVCGFSFWLTTNVWLSCVWFLFPGLLKCCHRNLFLPFGSCCYILICITFSAIYGLVLFKIFFHPFILVLSDFLGLLVWCL